MKKPHKKINVEIKEKEANEWIDQRIYTDGRISVEVNSEVDIDYVIIRMSDGSRLKINESYQEEMLWI